MPDIAKPTSQEFVADRRLLFELIVKLVSEVNSLRARVADLEP